MNSSKFRDLLRKRLFIVFLIVIQLAFFVYTLLNTSRTSSVLTGIMIVLSVMVTLYIVSKKDKGGYKLTWVIIILVFPLFGGLFYLIFHLQTTGRVINEGVKYDKTNCHKCLCISEKSISETDKEISDYLPMINYLEKYAGFPVYSCTESEYLSSGEEKFERLCDELDKAKNYIFLEYYIISEGKMWNTVFDILKEKVKEGVLVRVIYDDMGCFLQLPKDYKSVLESYGIQCEVFNPFTPLISTLQNNRDHRKIAVIDGKIAFTGGINLSDEYINESDKCEGHWKDAGIILKGPGAWSFTVMFLKMWGRCSGKVESYKDYYPSVNGDMNEKNDKCGFVQPYTDSPEDNENVGEHVYLKIINSARKYVYITTPYLIIDDSVVSALCLAAKSGVDVRIITPYVGDNKIVHMTTRSYYRELIKAGVKIFEYTDGFIHSKTFVSDDRIATVGTANLDFRSLYLNFECGTVLYDTESVKDEVGS